MDYVVLDLETTIRNTVGRNKGSAHCKDNIVVLAGLSINDDGQVHTCPVYSHKFCLFNALGNLVTADDLLLVGQNIKFDLLYLLRDEEFKNKFKSIQVWDTMLAEYLLSGQELKMASLDTLSAKYGGTQKDDRIKEYWKQGIDTDRIPFSELCDYLVHDVENTRLVFQKQLLKAQQDDMLPLITSQMKALKATTMMEYHGMYLDLNQLMIHESERQKEVHDYEVEFQHLFNRVKDDDGVLIRHYSVNINSNKHLSAVLFGGTIEHTQDSVVLDNNGDPVRYKSGLKKGQIKYRKTKHKVTYEPLLDTKYTTPNNNGYDVSEDVLRKYLDIVSTHTKECDALMIILGFRTASKELNTYYKGFRELCYDDSMIHGNLNHCRTNTGRLSSSEPNLQNMKSE